jgi:hypothetical protein
MITPIRIVLLAIISLLFACSLSRTALAGTYPVYNCRFPDDRPAPTDGWRIVAPSPAAIYDMSCTDGNGMGLWLATPTPLPPGFVTGIDIPVPPDLTVSSATLREERLASGGGTNWHTDAGFWGSPLDGRPWTAMEVCSGGCLSGVQNWHLVVDRIELRSFGLGVSCPSTVSTPCPAHAVAATVATGIALVVNDVHPPEFTEPVSGSLVDPRSTAAVRHLVFSVSDRGSGVRSAVLEIDGQILQTSQLGDAACVPPYGTFTPCPSTASGDFAIDTTALRPGPHSGRLLVSDASDGSPLEYDFNFAGLGPPSNIRACSSSRTIDVRVHRTPIPYGAQSIRMDITGLPHPPSRVLVVEDVNGALSILGDATRAGTRYVAHIRIGAPKSLRVVAPVDGGAAYVCSRVLRIAVRAGLRLRVGPRTVSNGDTIRFRGRLLGQGADDRLIEIQARAVGGSRRWTLVRSLRTDAHGMFEMAYTFRRTHERVRFEFRAVRRRAADFPYAFGASSRRSVLVRG